MQLREFRRLRLTLFHGDISDENVLSVSPSQNNTKAVDREEKALLI